MRFNLVSFVVRGKEVLRFSLGLSGLVLRMDEIRKRQHLIGTCLSSRGRKLQPPTRGANEPLVDLAEALLKGRHFAPAHDSNYQTGFRLSSNGVRGRGHFYISYRPRRGRTMGQESARARQVRRGGDTALTRPQFLQSQGFYPIQFPYQIRNK